MSVWVNKVLTTSRLTPGRLTPARIYRGLQRRFRARQYNTYARGAIRPGFAQGLAVDTKAAMSAQGYVSQYGQDKWVSEELFPGRRNGVFVDIGAHDGVSISNTWFLEKEFGWTGLAIEPIPEICAQLRSNRQCKIVEGCVGLKAGEVTFSVISGHAEMLSGITDTYHADHLKRIDRELATHGGNRREITVQCHSLNDLLNNYQFGRIDYMSVDVEGAELSILESIDFSAFEISALSIENNYCDYRIPKLMQSKGFTFHSVVGDEFYVNKKLNG